MTEKLTDAGAIAAVVRAVTVHVEAERAFTVFTDGFGTWWPRSHHIGDVDLADARIEPHVGGRWYERTVDGAEAEWGTVLAWEPPTRLLLAWHLDHDFRYDADPAHASEVEVRFIAQGPDATLVELEHRGFHRPPRGADIARQVGGDGGWGVIIAEFAAVCS